MLKISQAITTQLLGSMIGILSKKEINLELTKEFYRNIYTIKALRAPNFRKYRKKYLVDCIFLK